MKTERIYTVSFQRQSNGRIDEIIINVWAYNVQDARRIACETWENRNAANHGRVPHMFHLEVHRADTQVMEDLKVKNWTGKEIAGWNAMWTFIMTESRARHAHSLWKRS